jgi:hypothetical protein
LSIKGSQKLANKTYLKTALTISILFILLGVCDTTQARVIYVYADSGGGRIYTITYQAVDDSGNAAVASATVTVPHDQR